MKTLTQLSKEVHDAMNQPAELAKIYLYCAAEFGYYSDILKDIKIKKAEKWLQIKESGDEKDISDKKADMLFAQTDDGKKEIELTYNLKALEKFMGAIKQSAYLNKEEAKNLY
jgi:hypothetical protein